MTRCFCWHDAASGSFLSTGGPCRRKNLRMAEGPLPVGTTLQDRYEILAELGTGSFGRIYKARQLSTGREVAIKTLRLWDTDTAAAIRIYTSRFEREMQLCAALSHPNIVRLIDSGECDDGSLY